MRKLIVIQTGSLHRSNLKIPASLSMACGSSITLRARGAKKLFFKSDPLQERSHYFRTGSSDTRGELPDRTMSSFVGIVACLGSLSRSYKKAISGFACARAYPFVFSAFALESPK